MDADKLAQLIEAAGAADVAAFDASKAAEEAAAKAAQTFTDATAAWNAVNDALLQEGSSNTSPGFLASTLATLLGQKTTSTTQFTQIT